MKCCFCCNESKPLTEFHKHAGMADGHLNKCRRCVQEAVKEWRAKNTDCRKEEHKRNREKNGWLTREQWKLSVNSKSIGRKAVSIKYAHKRRMLLRGYTMNEFDEFVLEEAAKLASMRGEATGFKWHIDHIVPLMHKDVCGLNSAVNLQVVPASWNVRKGNRNTDSYWLKEH